MWLQGEVKSYQVYMEDLSLYIELTKRLNICPAVNLGFCVPHPGEVELCFCVWLSALQTLSKTKGSIYDVKGKTTWFWNKVRGKPLKDGNKSNKIHQNNQEVFTPSIYVYHWNQEVSNW